MQTEQAMRRTWWRLARWGAAILLTLGALTVQAQEFPMSESQGTIDSIDLGKRVVVISGYRYRPGYDLNVEIAGSYGAFTMLQPGMKVRIAYRVKSGTERELVSVQEMPRNAPIDEA